MKRVEVALALLQREGRYFLQRRSEAARLFPGLWEFPGGKLEPGESAQEALERELVEEVGLRPVRVEALSTLVHAYPGLEIVLHPFACSGEGRMRTPLAWGWFLPREMRHLRLLEGTEALRVRVFGE
jgi:mutator protein MutT